MFHTISWAQLGWFTCAIVVIYYLIIMCFFFREEVLSYFRKWLPVTTPLKSQHLFADSNEKNGSVDQPKTHLNETEIPFSRVHEFIEDYKVLLVAAKRAGSTKEQLLENIGIQFRDIRVLARSPISKDLEAHICLQAKEVCQIDIYSEDLKALWLG